jgi:hypothetical protein
MLANGDEPTPRIATCQLCRLSCYIPITGGKSDEDGEKPAYQYALDGAMQPLRSSPLSPLHQLALRQCLAFPLKLPGVQACNQPANSPRPAQRYNAPVSTHIIKPANC